MNESYTHLEEIDRYLEGAMTPEERRLFEVRTEGNPALRRAVEEQKLLVDSVRKLQSHHALRNSFSALHDTMEGSSVAKQVQIKTRGTNWWKLTGVAASVALLAVAGTWFLFASMQESESAKFQELSRRLEQISKSQHALMQDMAEANKKEEAGSKEDVVSARYAGTGFLITRGYVATSYHLIRDADSVYIQNEKYGILKTTVIKTDQVNDVAILRIEDDSFKSNSIPYQISSKTSDLGESVFTLGFPREDIVYGEGTISAATGYKQNVTAYQIAVPVNPGNSGGPLFDQSGNLVGMISGMQTKTQGAAFAVKSGILLDVVSTMATDSTVGPLQLSRSNRLKSLNRVQQVKKIRDFVFVVKVYDQP
jgi:serine protease Do